MADFAVDLPDSPVGSIPTPPPTGPLSGQMPGLMGMAGLPDSVVDQLRPHAVERDEYGELFFSCKYSLTAEEEAQVKREKRMICNRMSALMSRVNQRARLEELERLVQQLRQQNSQLQSQLQSSMHHSYMLEAQVTALVQENARLQRMLHASSGMPPALPGPGTVTQQPR